MSSAGVYNPALFLEMWMHMLKQGHGKTEWWEGNVPYDEDQTKTKEEDKIEFTDLAVVLSLYGELRLKGVSDFDERCQRSLIVMSLMMRISQLMQRIKNNKYGDEGPKEGEEGGGDQQRA